MNPIPFYQLTQAQLADELKSRGYKGFRAQQLYKWIYQRRVEDFEQMTDLSKKVREEFAEIIDLTMSKVVNHRISQDGTEKFLFDVGDGKTVETVLIPSGDRLTLCVSSEVGCNMACQFCFTGKKKMTRRLETREIVSQLIKVADSLGEDRRITNVVFMGMGEPLDNPDAVFDAIDIWHNPNGYGLSKKKVTVSTSGIVPMIEKVTDHGVRLAVSLNAVTDDVRTKIMPINKKWPIKELLNACVEHSRATNDKVTFEYVLLRGITDSIEDARALHKLLKRVPSKINIIPFNEHPGSGFFRPGEEKIDAFQKELIRLGSHVLRRKTMGRDIYAACGQLTSAYKEHPERMTV